MDIIENIHHHYSKLSKTQKKIADYILSNPEQACFLSLNELSNQVETTEVTVMNFSRKIGYENFTELKKGLQDFIQRKLSPSQKILTALENIKDENSKLTEIIHTDLTAIHKTIKNLHIDDIKKAVKMLKKANKIYLIGVGISKIVVEFLLFRLKMLGFNVETIDIYAYNIMVSQVLKIESNDVFIVVTFPNYSKYVSVLTNYLAKNRHNIIAITNYADAPSARDAQIVFPCSSESLVFYNSITAAIAVSHILLSILALETKDTLMNEMEKMEEIEKIFLKGGFI